MKICFPCNLALVLFLIMVVHVWATITSAYFTYLWIDIPLHFAGGAWLAAAAYYFFFVRRSIYKISVPFWVGILFLVGVSVFVGVCWEFFEYSMDVLSEQYLGGTAIHQEGLKDTLADLFFDMAGAFLISLYFLYVKKSFKYDH